MTLALKDTGMKRGSLFLCSTAVEIEIFLVLAEGVVHGLIKMYYYPKAFSFLK